MPNFQDRYLKQGTVGTYGNESLPNITGHIPCPQMGAYGTVSGAFYSEVTASNLASGSWSSSGVSFAASRSSSTYKNNAKVNPDNAEILYVIKF